MGTGQPCWTGAADTPIALYLVRGTSCRQSSPQIRTPWTSSSTRTALEQALDGVSTGRQWHQVWHLISHFCHHDQEHCHDRSHISTHAKKLILWFCTSTRGVEWKSWEKTSFDIIHRWLWMKEKNTNLQGNISNNEKIYAMQNHVSIETLKKR